MENDVKPASSAALAALFHPSRLRPAARLARWAVLACLALAPLAGARGLDTNFATNGIDILSEGGADVHAIAHLPRPDGGSAVVFAYQTVNSCPAERWCLVVERFADNGFFIGQNYTSVTANFTRVSAAAIDSQGRIVVVGSHKIGSGPDHDFRIVRLTPQGALDGSFIREVSFDVANSDWRDEALAVAIDATDRIVVAGSANTSNIGDVEFGIARLLPTGTLDPAFNNGGKRRIPYEVIPGRSFAIATAMSIDSAGRIVIGGNVLDLNLGRVRIGMARLLPSGDYDTTWCQTTCTANVYPAIHSGRSVTYFGNINDPRTHTVAALAVNGSNQVAIVGDHTVSVQQGYAMTFDTAGNWNAEKSLNGAATDPDGASATMGGVAFISPSDLIVTGVAGYSSSNLSWFFAQRLVNSASTSSLTPRGGWGFSGEALSLIWFALGGISGDPYGNVPHATAIDSAGRVLMSGATPGGNGKLVGVAARLQGDAMFRNGFE